uniref:Secreted protein n=1 Tax=Steinernema glaseri TaxID=37863 RepID=A0A1I8A988_9BILA
MSLHLLSVLLLCALCAVVTAQYPYGGYGGYGRGYGGYGGYGGIILSRILLLHYFQGIVDHMVTACMEDTDLMVDTVGIVHLVTEDTAWAWACRHSDLWDFSDNIQADATTGT